MSYNAVGQIATGYRQPPGPGGVFGAVSESELSQYYIRGEWSSGLSIGGEVRGPIVGIAHEGETLEGKVPAVTWIRDLCAEGKQVFRHVSGRGTMNGKPFVSYGLLATFQTDVVAAVTKPNWAPGEKAMEQISCETGCPEGMIELPGGGCQIDVSVPAPVLIEKTEAVARTMLIGGVVVAGVLIAGVYFLTRKKQ